MKHLRSFVVAAGMAACTLAGSASAALPPLPTPPGSSTGSAIADAYDGPDGSGVFFSLHGTLRFGSATHDGYFVISYRGGTSTQAQLTDNATGARIASCQSEDLVSLAVPAPTAAVIRCTGHFPDEGNDRTTTLVFALPTVTNACPRCEGYRYEGSYVG
jgi:hypothetical protein